MTANPNQNSTARPKRTAGISLALLVTIIFYTVIPLVQVGFTTYIRFVSNRNNALVGANFDTIGGGLGITAVTDGDLLARAVPALIYLLIAILGWRGKPSLVRYLVIGSAVTLPLWYGLLIYLQLLEDQRLGVLSSNAFAVLLQNTYLVTSVLAALYTMWYMNRAPARAFYRGYYLESEIPTEPT